MNFLSSSMLTFCMPGVTSLSSWSHLPAISGSNVLKPVMLAPGRDRLWTYPAPTGLLTTTKTMGMVVAGAPSARTASMPGVPFTTRISDAAIDEVLGQGLRHLEAAAIPHHVDDDVAQVNPARLAERSGERVDPQLALRIVLGRRHHEADAPRPAGRRLCEGRAGAHQSGPDRCCAEQGRRSGAGSWRTPYGVRDRLTSHVVGSVGPLTPGTF